MAASSRGHGKTSMDICSRAPHRRRSTARISVAIGLLTLLLGGMALSQTERRGIDPDLPEAEFHLARLGFRTNSYASSRGPAQPMWRVDYPEAELHFLPALARLTNLSVAPAVGDGIRHFEITDERIFDYPFLWLQQPAAANWNPSAAEIEALREYLERGGFFLVDDFHGESEFYLFRTVMARVFPEREIVEIPGDDVLMHLFFNMDDRLQIPGQRHLMGCSRGDLFSARMGGQPYWLGIYDDTGRIMVAIYYNIDMGDAWEHADDPCYPAPMTGQAYRLGVNSVIYAMTH